MRKDYREFIMETSPSEEFPLQGEGQSCCSSGESCFAWLCGSIVGLYLHFDMGMGPILPHVLAVTISDFTQIMQTGHLCGPQWKKIRRETDSRSILIPKAALRCRLTQNRQPAHYFPKQWIAKCPWDMGVTCQQKKCKCKLWKNQVGYPGSYC